MRGIDMGNVPAWISAVGGVTATVAAVFAAVYTWQALERERKRDESRQQRERRAQADKITAWIVTLYDDDPPKYKGMTNDDPNWVVRVRNPSAQAIYEMGIYVATVSGGPSWEGAKRVRLLPPDVRVDLLVPLAPIDIDPDEAVVSIAFTDSAGTRWERDGQGHLTKIDTTPQPRPESL